MGFVFLSTPRSMRSAVVEGVPRKKRRKRRPQQNESEGEDSVVEYCTDSSDDCAPQAPPRHRCRELWCALVRDLAIAGALVALGLHWRALKNT